MTPRHDADAGETGHSDSGWRAGMCGNGTVTLSIRLLSPSRELAGRGSHTPAASKYRDNRSATMRTHESSNTGGDVEGRSEEHTSELQSLMRLSYAVFCLNKKRKTLNNKPHLQAEISKYDDLV